MNETPTPGSANADPSMDDILASIRRILAEDETASPAVAAPPAAPLKAGVAQQRDDVLELSSAMIVGEAVAAPPQPAPAPPPTQAFAPAPVLVTAPAISEASLVQPASVAQPASRPAPQSLVAPETAAASAASVDTLMRHLANERALTITRNGPSLEDVIRDEMRPLLKHWLDTNLPALVERLVRAEIARVVDRSVT